MTIHNIFPFMAANAQASNLPFYIEYASNKVKDETALC